jgi:hypothetical protein
MEDTQIILCGLGVGSTTFSKDKGNVLDLTSNQNCERIVVEDLCEVISDIYHSKLFKYILVPILEDGVRQSRYHLKNWSKKFSVVVREDDNLIKKWEDNGNVVLQLLSTKLGKGEYLSTNIDKLTPIKI